MKKKKGEQQAVEILKTLGIVVDENYCDDNSCESMPDLKCLDGRYIEVTHTKHNNYYQEHYNRYIRRQLDGNASFWMKKNLETEIKCSEALERFFASEYESFENGSLTDEGKNQYEKDCGLLKKHMGFDPSESDDSKRNSEFNCDIPNILFSTDNILQEIVEDKAKKHDSGASDLFLFVAEEEYELLKELISRIGWDKSAGEFLQHIFNSPFQTIYICAWNFFDQEYNTVNPHMIRFYKKECELKWVCYNR